VWKTLLVDSAAEHRHGPESEISREIVGVLKERIGRGPTRVKTHIHDDCALVVLREGHTVSEGTMHGAGSGREVAQTRVDLSETIRDPLIQVIERNVQRRVIGFMSSSQQSPDLLSFVFVFDTSPLLEVVEAEKTD